jgi:hypothetical protein
MNGNNGKKRKIWELMRAQWENGGENDETMMGK